MAEVPSGFLDTGDIPVVPKIRYSFTAPGDLWVSKKIYGMILDYAAEGNWFQVGTATPDQASLIFTEIWESLVVLSPVGSIILFAGIAPPANTLICDGSSVLRIDYPQLFSVIGVTWGAVDASHFTLPDLRGAVPVGAGQRPGGSFFTLATYAGEETHTLSSAEMPSHAHTDSGHTHSESVAAPTAISVGPGAPAPSAVPASGSTGSASANIQAAGGGGAHNNLQPYGVINYAIIFE